MNQEKQRVFLLTTSEALAIIQCVAEVKSKSAVFENARFSVMQKITDGLKIDESETSLDDDIQNYAF